MASRLPDRQAPARRHTPLRIPSQPPDFAAEKGRLMTKTADDAGYTDPGNNGELSEGRDAAKYASHPANTHESTNAF
jgi:hypothetical protein